MLYLKTALWEETQTCCYTIDFASHKGNWPKYLDTQHLQTNFFHTVATLKCAVQQKPNCMQRFFSAVWAGDSKVFLAPEVARVTFSDSVSAPVSNCLNPGPDPTILQIWESDSCSDSCYNHRSNRNLPMFLPKKWPHRLLLLPKWKNDSGSGFSQIFDSGSGSERKTQNPAAVDSGNPDLPCTQELHTLGTRTSSCFGAMDRKFCSVFLPSVVHGLVLESLTSVPELSCGWRTAWREATLGWLDVFAPEAWSN